MKKLFLVNKIFIALCLFTAVNSVQAQNDADPAITSFSFASSPIAVNANTTLTVFFINNGFRSAIAAGSVGLNISLPTSVQYKAFPESPAALSGTFASKFNWTYNAVTKTFIGKNNQPIAPGDGGTVKVTIRGYIPVTQRVSIANIIRYNPGAYPNENINNNNLTASLGVVPAFANTGKVLNNDLTVYPNPVIDKVVIKSNGGGGTVQSVTLYSLEGKQMIQVNNFILGNSIDMRSYGPGSYMFKIVDKEGNEESIKVVKK